ncbi:lysophospholipid acyltransferase family protein [Geoalkalibacter subterraneus]|uniref:DUF374 domain-containing protein n=1 Tax=Geoalkalibacter subterraneus TaxID=483547 RepID=A0A0B5FTD4_9BACT|nr:lysophospholipid acyltransferase family protein [Geoalkalibacter subterraneus]AJF06886.1 hypothetical protein GSUB_10420 [Geoalkalibacter subterraneus]
MKKQIRHWVLFQVVPRLAAGFINLLYRSMRTEVVGLPQSRQNQEPVIIAFWHDQLLLMVKGYHGPGARILISESKDGELIAKTMECFGQGAVRGSSTRGGRKAFKALMDLARQPYDLVITPDGPRGPRHEVKEGVVQLARLTRRPVVPMAFACSRGYRFRSWDRFLLPFPFSRGVFAYGDPLTYDSSDTMESFQQKLSQGLATTLQTAKKRLEEQGVSAV